MKQKRTLDNCMPLKLATSTWDQAEFDAIKRVTESQVFTMGKEVEKFENQFADYFDSKYAVMVNSGSSANLLMIAALFFIKENNLKPGDEIIVPAVSWSTTYTPLQQYGLKVVFVDIDLKTLNIDINNVKKAITKKTKAILAVNLLGNPCEFDELMQISKDKDIFLLEDNCESMGAKYKSKFCGTFGLMGTFSTYFSHHISTMEGGVILTDNEEIYHILLCLRAHGWTRNLPATNYVSGEKSKNSFEESFKFVLPGFNVRPLEMSGAIGQEQLKKLDNIVQGRQKNSKKFNQLFKNNNQIVFQKEVYESSYFGFSMIFKDQNVREKIISVLTKKGVEVRPIVAGNFLNNDVVNYFDYRISGKLENAEIVDRCGLFIGNHHYDISSELGEIKAIIDENL